MPTDRGPNALDPLLIDLSALDTAIAEHRSTLEPALDRLRADADAALSAGPFSVTNKAELPPSSDPNDFLSQGDYWWPDPDAADGVPYIRRDGETNPEIEALDEPRVTEMTDAVEALALAAHCFPDDRERYADRARTLVRTFFLDEETLMNPHLEYAQRIPGRTEGRGIGIIDTRYFRRVTDAVAVLARDGEFPAADLDALRSWFATYTDWLLHSENGRHEAAHHNNHGTWFDTQVLALGLFAGERETVAPLVEDAHVAERRLGHQFDGDGSQPLELERTQPVHYSAFNLEAYVELATLYEAFDVDLWGYEKPNRPTLRTAVEWLAAAVTDRRWEGLRTVPGAPDPEMILLVLRRAAVACDDPRLEDAVAAFDGFDPAASRTNLRSPPPAVR